MLRRELFGSLCGMVFLVNLARVVYAPLIQPVAADLNLTAAALGVVATATWLGSASPRLPTGILLTYIPRHYVIGLAGALLIVTALFTGRAQTVPNLTIGAFLMGVSSGMYFIAANPLVSELFPENVGQAIGVHGMSSQLAAVGAPLVVSAILLVGDWQLIFGCIAIIAAIITIGFTWAAWRTPLPDAGAADQSVLDAAKQQWPLILTGLAFMGTIGFLWNGLFNLYGDYLTIIKGIPPARGRLLLSGMFAAGLPAFLVTGRLADRIPNLPLCLGITTGFTLSVAALTVARGLVVIAVCSLLAGYFMFSLIPALDTYLLTSLPDQHRASTYAVYSSVMMAVQAFGSGAVGLTVARGVSYTRAFQSLVVLAALVIGGLGVLYRTNRLPTPRSPLGETVNGETSG